MENESFVERDWEHAGLRCVVLDNVGMGGYRCGYVAVKPGHPFYGESYFADTSAGVPEEVIDVHGGVTFSDEKLYTEGLHSEEEWWFGYDCSHYGDSPSVQDLAYCVNECEYMASQLAALNNGG